MPIFQRPTFFLRGHIVRRATMTRPLSGLSGRGQEKTPNRFNRGKQFMPNRVGEVLTHYNLKKKNKRKKMATAARRRSLIFTLTLRCENRRLPTWKRLSAKADGE